MAMTFWGQYNAAGEVEAVSLRGQPFEQHAEWSSDLFDQADPRFLERDGDTITLRCVEGTATYRITGETAKILTSELVKVGPA